MHSPTLLVLAAGMGSRYGGLKQIDPVGPSGETVLDYAVFDALRAGFGRVVFVIRREFDAVFRAQVGAKYAGRAAVDYVYQALDALPEGFAVPAGREKPWGTGHAVWCARDAVRGPFAVINADDFYGVDSFRQLGRFLQRDASGGILRADEPKREGSGNPRGAAGANVVPEYAMVGFRLANTLSEHGAVSRGICTAAGDGRLESIAERTGILATEVGGGRALSGDEVVSMNCWGFTPELFVGLDAQFRDFLTTLDGRDAAGGQASPTKAEFYLPAAVSELIARGEAVVRVQPTESAWFGVTYREDKPRVVAAIAELVRSGQYPAKLF